MFYEWINFVMFQTSDKINLRGLSCYEQDEKSLYLFDFHHQQDSQIILIIKRCDIFYLFDSYLSNAQRARDAEVLKYEVFSR